MTTVLRITPNPYSTNFDFDEEEYRLATFKPVNKSDIQIYDRRAPNVIDNINGQGYVGWSGELMLWNTLDLQIFHKYSTTRTKVESLFGYEIDFRVYYKHEDVPGTYYQGILDPTYTTKYVFGEEMQIISTLKFYPVYV